MDTWQKLNYAKFSLLYYCTRFNWPKHRQLRHSSADADPSGKPKLFQLPVGSTNNTTTLLPAAEYSHAQTAAVTVSSSYDKHCKHPSSDCNIVRNRCYIVVQNHYAEPSLLRLVYSSIAWSGSPDNLSATLKRFLPVLGISSLCCHQSTRSPPFALTWKLREKLLGASLWINIYLNMRN